MSDKVELKLATLKGFIQTDQVTVENINDWAESLNGTVEEGILTFMIDDYTHRAIPGDWIVVYRPSGDLLVFPNKFFNRLHDIEPIG